MWLCGLLKGKIGPEQGNFEWKQHPSASGTAGRVFESYIAMDSGPIRIFWTSKFGLPWLY
jgi:hypothetical protein